MLTFLNKKNSPGIKLADKKQSQPKTSRSLFATEKKFILSAAIASLFLTALAGHYAYIHGKNDILQYYQYKEKQSIDVWHHLMMSKIESLRTDLMVAALLSDIRSALNGNPRAIKDLKEDFLTISKFKEVYAQIRLLDRNGRELVRVDRVGSKSFVVSQDKLQDKGRRYYFNDTISLPSGSIYISPLDLNIEHGIIETPYNPMLRLATNVYDDNTSPSGVVILNYHAENLLKKFRQATAEDSVKFMVNNDGYWLIGPKPETEWGFLFEGKQSEKMAFRWPDEWKIISDDINGQFITKNGIYTFATLFPLQNGDVSSQGTLSGEGISSREKIGPKEYFWKIFSYVPENSLLMKYKKRRNAVFLYCSMFYCIVLTAVIAKARTRRIEKDMNRARDESHKILEQKVNQRTDKLFKINLKLTQEIKDRKKSEQIISEKEEEIRLLFSSTAEGIYGLDPAGNCTFCNQSCIEQLGYQSEADLIGRYMHGLVHISDTTVAEHTDSQCLFRQSLEKGQLVHSDNEIFWRADGSHFLAECWSHPIIKDDRIIGAVVSFWDITKRKELESQIINAQKMEVIGILAGGIAHDLNNILSPIIGYTQMVKESFKNTNDEITEDLDEVLFAATRGSDLVRQILAISRQTSDSKTLISVAPIVKEALKLITVAIPPNITLQTNIENNPPNITMEATKFHQIIMNLCTNAIHSMEKGGGKLTIDLLGFQHDETSTAINDEMPSGRFLHLHVSDQGCGIAPDQLEKIFDPFYTSKPEGKGTGLGLSVVHGIVKANDGFISVHSEPGTGTAFDLYFPEADDPETADKCDALTSKNLISGCENVLLVDDRQYILKLEERRLQKLGYHVTVAINPEEALDFFDKNYNTLDIVISDYRMPGMTGKSFAKELRRRRSDIPIILCSGLLEYSNEDSEIHTYFDQIIIKPTNKHTLAQAIRTVLDS